MYLVAIVLPPLAVLAAGKFFQFLFNLLLCLTLVGIPLAMIHAVCVWQAEYRSLREHQETLRCR